MLTSEDLSRIPIDSTVLRCLRTPFAVNWVVLPIEVREDAVRIVIPNYSAEDQNDLAHRVSMVTNRRVEFETADYESLTETVRVHYYAMDSRVKNCNRRFVFKCPRAWESMKTTAHPLVRHCDSCDRTVHFCLTEDDLDRSVQNGHCVAVYNVKANLTTSGIALGGTGEPSDETKSPSPD
jgi:hypothetical protein